MPYIGAPPQNRILSSDDIAQGAVTLNDINFTDVPTNMDITGTIDKHTMRLAEGVTVTGDVTISEDLVLAKISDDGDAITMTSDGSSRTITGSGSIQAATIAATPQPTTVVANTSIASNSITLAKMASNSVDSAQYVNGSIDSAHIADNQVTLAKMAGGTDGQIITYDASGDPVAVGPGTDGQVLTSTGAGSPPAFEDASGGNYTDDGWKFITSNNKDYTASSGQSAFNYANIADFDRQQYKGSNVSESAGVFTLATAGLYSVSLLCIDDGSSNIDGLQCWLFQEDVSASAFIAYEPAVYADKLNNYTVATGSFTWYVNIGAGDKLHIRARGGMKGNWCGSGSPSNCFHGCRIG